LQLLAHQGPFKLPSYFFTSAWLLAKGKSLFLTIQLLPRFGFDHQTSKPDIFDHLTVKTVHN
jgi:hypothetical protein